MLDDLELLLHAEHDPRPGRRPSSATRPPCAAVPPTATPGAGLRHGARLVMGFSLLVRPGQWNEPLPGIWVYITPSTTRCCTPRSTGSNVHRNEQGDVWIIRSGNNAGVRVQSTPPDTADLDGGSL
jgi:hypothetical protein